MFATLRQRRPPCAMPTALQQSKICRLTDGSLAPPAYCAAQCSLTDQQLRALPSIHASQVLTAAGCLCHADSLTDCLGQDYYLDAVTQALRVAAARQGLPLSKLVSEHHLGTSTFDSVCALLADFSPKAKESYWQMLKECSIFEDLQGQVMSLSDRNFIVLPSAKWEKILGSMGHLLA